MIFTSFAPQYMDEQDRTLLKRMNDFYYQSFSLNQDWQTQADIDTRVEAGDVSVFGQLYGNAVPFNTYKWAFNHVRPTIAMPAGYQRRNRKSTIAIPIENASNKTADNFTKVLMHINRRESVDEIISEAFHGSLVTGMNLLEVYLDFRNDPISGDIKVDKCSYSEILVDPFFRKHDFSDCTGVWRRKFITRSEACSLFPDAVNEIMRLPGNGVQDFRFQYMPENIGLGSANVFMRDQITCDTFTYRDYRFQKLLVDVKTGESIEWKSDDDKRLKLFLHLHPQITEIEQYIPTTMTGIVLQGKVFYDGPNLTGTDDWNYIPVLSYYNPQMQYMGLRLMGMVRSLRDPQYLFTRRIINSADLLESTANSGWIFKPGSLINPLDIWTQVGQGKGIAVRDEKSLDDIRPIVPPQIPPSMFQLADTFSQEIQKISGVSETLMGTATDSKIGITEQLRQGAGLTILQNLFDQLDHSQKLLGRVMINIIQANYTPGKIKNIIHEDPTPEFYNKAFGKYDCAIEEGFNTTTQRQLEFAQKLQLRELGVYISDMSLLESATLQGKDKLIQEAMQNAQAQQQAQQAQMQLQQQKLQSDMKLSDARAQADIGLGIERASRLQENQALALERKAEARKDDEIADLNKAKAIREIAALDIDHIRQLLELLKIWNPSSENEQPPSPTESLNERLGI